MKCVIIPLKMPPLISRTIRVNDNVLGEHLGMTCNVDFKGLNDKSNCANHYRETKDILTPRSNKILACMELIKIVPKIT